MIYTDYQNGYFRVLKNDDYFIVDEFKSKHAAAILLKHIEKGFLLVKIFRHSLNEVLLEIPRGNAEVGETSVQCVIRETKEETGFLIDKKDLQILGTVAPNSGILTSKIDIYYASISGEPTYAIDDETLGHDFYSFNDLTNLITTGKIIDSFSLSAISLFILKKA